jgi:hypothetical protein
VQPVPGPGRPLGGHPALLVVGVGHPGHAVRVDDLVHPTVIGAGVPDGRSVRVVDHGQPGIGTLAVVVVGDRAVVALALPGALVPCVGGDHAGEETGGPVGEPQPPAGRVRGVFQPLGRVVAEFHALTRLRDAQQATRSTEPPHHSGEEAQGELSAVPIAGLGTAQVSLDVLRAPVVPVLVDDERQRPAALVVQRDAVVGDVEPRAERRCPAAAEDATLVIARVVGARPGEDPHGHRQIDVPPGVVADRGLDAVTDVRVAAVAAEELGDGTVEERSRQRHAQPSSVGWISC